MKTRFSFSPVLGLCALGLLPPSGAFAQDVTLYGVIDLGLQFTRTDPDAGSSSSALTMASGSQSGSRFGLQGTEKLGGTGLEIGFVLENGFSADTGTPAQGGRLFGRESRLFVRGPFGEVSFGRVGMLTSDIGSCGLVGGLTPFGTSWAGAVEGSTYQVGHNRIDNAVTWKSPDLSGLTLYAQYTPDTNSLSGTGTEGKSSVDRYGALGASFTRNALSLVLTADVYDWSSSLNTDNGWTLTGGGSYDFGPVKLFLGLQYFENARKAGVKGTSGRSDGYAVIGLDDPFRGWSAMAGASAPLKGGTLMAAVGRADGEGDESSNKDEFTRLGVSVGYTYRFTKRTNVYSVLGWYKDDFDLASGENRDESVATLWLGMAHRF